MGDIITDNNQYLTLQLGKEFFAIEITKVREVLDYINITKVPRTPDFMLGVINLRGNVVPVVDLHLTLGMPKQERTVDTCIIIVEVQIGVETILIGALADAVQEVVNIPDTDISPPPKIGVKLNTEFLRGMGKQNDQFLIILNIDKVLTTQEIEEVERATSIVPSAEMIESGETIESLETQS
ncbi:MAG: chemotaxis protein CheW [Deltaproteobacteria bacterium]|nr:chemotaxis protein CheW [Deltaproteobacteria bacterium]